MANPLLRVIDPLGDDRERAAPKYRFIGDWRSWAVPGGIGVALFLVGLLGLLHDAYQFWFAYLTAWVFCLTITLGALIFVMVQHVSNARWVTVVRRFPETIMVNFGVLAVLGLPIFLFGMYELYHWTHAELYDPASSYYDVIVAGKAPYFFWPGTAGDTPIFFYLRVVLYFFVWILVSTKLYRRSVEHDVTPGVDTNAALRFTSAWGIPLVAVTINFAAFDLVMSLDPHWFSMIFGVYFFASGFVASIAAMTLMALLYSRSGMLRGQATVEHFHDLGKYLFAFTVFWMYIFFSQFMLIWYANIPEEVVFFQIRMAHGWGTVFYAILLFHFVIPFFILIPRFTKRSAPILTFMCGWILVVHFIHLWWVIKPNLFLATGFNPVYEQAALTWIDASLWLGMVGIVVAATMWRASRHAIAPYNDPYYPASLQFENV
jgi:hypothetical protein